MPIQLIHANMVIAQAIAEAGVGLGNGNNALVPAITVNVVAPGLFLGAPGNPAIFVNAATFAALGGHHPLWVLNQTIAVFAATLARPTVDAVGILVHETGHGFNVAAGIPNTEGNAYIFEIEVLSRLVLAGNNVLAILGVTQAQVNVFLVGRLPQYRQAGVGDLYLNALRGLVELM